MLMTSSALSPGTRYQLPRRAFIVEREGVVTPSSGGMDTLRYILLYMAVSGEHRVLSTCIGAVDTLAATWIGYRP